jgi:hypothetical protein
MKHLSQNSQQILTAQIGNHGLERFTEKIFALARENVEIYASAEIRNLEIGQSRVGGGPDLPSMSAWPTLPLTNGGTGYLIFFLQLNLAELPPVIGSFVPDHGLLSVFSDRRVYIEQGQVLYHGDLASLTYQRLPEIAAFADGDLDETDLPPCYRPPTHLAFRQGLSLPSYVPWVENDADHNAYMELYLDLRGVSTPGDSDLTHIGSMFGVPPNHTVGEDNPEWGLLLNLHSWNRYFDFGDCGHQAFSVETRRALVGDFSTIAYEYHEP